MILPLIIYIYIYDKNLNLNSYTCIFWRSQGLNPHPHRGVRPFGERDYPGPNAQWQFCSLSVY